MSKHDLEDNGKNAQACISTTPLLTEHVQSAWECSLLACKVENSVTLTMARYLAYAYSGSETSSEWNSDGGPAVGPGVTRPPVTIPSCYQHLGKMCLQDVHDLRDADAPQTSSQSMIQAPTYVVPIK